MPALSYTTKSSPKDVAETMVRSWRRNNQVSEAYLNTALDVIDRVQYLGSDVQNQFSLDYALVRALMRLDKEGVYIYPGVRNIQMGNDRLMEFVRTYDPEHAGELTIVKNASKLKCKPEEIAMMICNIIVYVSCLYALKMNKKVEVRCYLGMMDDKNKSHRTRVWLQEEMQDFLAKNRSFSEDRYTDNLCQYITKPHMRAAAEKKSRLW